ncbi:MAG: hypothetical protein U0W24_10285 [Bacteroidales bacterium]
MAKKILRNITICLINLIIINGYSKACGWYEYDDTYRMSMFRAEIPALLPFRPFYYTSEYWNRSFPSIVNNDWEANCREWQAETDISTDTRDIYCILYKVSPDMFFLAYNNGNLNSTFLDNTFINFLLKPENKEWLDYLVFAKKNEFNNQFLSDPWGNDYYLDFGHHSFELVDDAQVLLEKTRNENLKRRYAYQLIRLARQTGNNERCIALYNQYFDKNEYNGVLKYWAMLHKAEALDEMGKSAEANYLYSVVINNCDEKKMRCYNLFSHKNLEEILKFTKNNDEKAGIRALAAIQNPGPALEQIKKVSSLNSTHKALPILIMREINKLEDWIFTPEFTAHSPSIKDSIHYSEWDEKYDSIKMVNRKKDLAYLAEFNRFLTTIQQNAGPGLNDYYLLARAHLHLIARENQQALALFSKIGNKASPSVLLQKDTELLLFYSFEKNVNNEKIKEKIVSVLQNLEKTGTRNISYIKQFHSVCEVLSRSYRQTGDIVTAFLLKMYAENFKSKFEMLSANEDWWPDSYVIKDYYWQIAYPDRFARPTDIDKLIQLMEKKNRTNFENYLLKQCTTTKEALLDLKGTIALRMGDFKTSSEAFSALPHDYWKNNYEFSKYLRFNPFTAPNLPVDTNYMFNKSDVLKEIVRLNEEADKNDLKKAENYLKIGQFLYNCSYWGNSWMMLSYSWTTGAFYQSTTFGYYDVLFGNLNQNAENYVGNFFECKLAGQYLQEAEKYTSSKELLAMITFMQHCCAYANYNWNNMKLGWDAELLPFKADYISVLYRNYSNTNTFSQVHCPLLDDYAMTMGIEWNMN